MSKNETHKEKMMSKKRHKEKMERKKMERQKTTIEGKTVNVDCIITFQDKDQEFFQFDMFIQPLNKTVSHQLPVELELLNQVISQIDGTTDDLVKISLCMTHPDFRGSREEFVEMGFGFAFRTNLKYYFQPDQRDFFETVVMKVNGVASRTLPFNFMHPNRR